jgi:hypothetical protein
MRAASIPGNAGATPLAVTAAAAAVNILRRFMPEVEFFLAMVPSFDQTKGWRDPLCLPN